MLPRAVAVQRDFWRGVDAAIVVLGSNRWIRPRLEAAGQVRSYIGRVGARSELGATFDELEAGKYVGRAVVTDLGGSQTVCSPATFTIAFDDATTHLHRLARTRVARGSGPTSSRRQ